MIAQARGNFLRISPTKVRQVIDLIRGKDIPTAMAILAQVNKGAKEKVTKIVASAAANAKQKGLAEDQLYISKITADHGPAWKRFRAAGFGRANPILKRTTHIVVHVDLKTKAK